VDVGQIVSELYGLRPDEFTAARNLRSRQLTADGDRTLALLVRETPKPSVAAWAINNFSRSSNTAHEEYVSLGDKLRAAQAHPDRATLTQLVDERRSLITKTVKAVTKLATHNGVGLSPSAASEVEQTFHAAVTDADAAAAVFSGRLVHGLTSDGIQPVDLSGAVAGMEAQAPRAKAVDRPKKRSRSTPAKAGRAAAAADAAKAAAAVAETALASVRERLVSLDREGERLAQDARDLQDQFRILEERQADFDERKSALDREQRTALEAAQKARRTARSAEGRLH
jgi:hypothetical protein